MQQSFSPDVIAKLMKYGRKEEIQSYFNSVAPAANDNRDFVSFMDGLIAGSGFTRRTVAQRAGLSQDYVYKILRGDKKTTERDYIIAICMAVKANLAETQTALELYSMPPLNNDDPRSAVILAAIYEGKDMDVANDWLRKAGFLEIKISPDMPSAKVGPVRSNTSLAPMVNSVTDEGQAPSKDKRRFIKLKKAKTTVTAEHAGHAPMDYFFAAEIKLQDKDKNILFAQACFWPDGTCLFSIDKTSMYVEAYLTDSEKLEEFFTLEEASESQYFPYYLELDRLTDAKAKETMDQVNDTRYYNGFRLGAKFESFGIAPYAEVFNIRQPQLSEYLQVQKTEDGYLYSASHKSRYMLIELGPLYEYYFPKTEDLPLFEVTSLDELGDGCRYRIPFMNIVKIMEEQEKSFLTGGIENE